jgi:exodeoxyribonuclease VII large subunit
MRRRGPRDYYTDGGREERGEPQGEDALTVSQVMKYVQFKLGKEFSRVSVVGEIGALRNNRGHRYFTLKDQKHALPCVLFSSNAQRLKFDLREGMRVVAQGQVTLYTQQSRVQLEVRRLEVVGEGAELIALEKLKAKLRAEGLFDEARKKPLPGLPRTLGVVTSAGGAVIHDIIKVSRRRMPGVSIVLAPTKVAGRSATPNIVRALKRLDERGVCDVILLARGGGSAEDLAAFNEEAVARAVAGCETPVISAVGHESDYTLADLVADRRAATPSHAAELVLPTRESLDERLHRAQVRLGRAFERAHAGAVMRIGQQDKRLERAARAQAQRARARLEALKSRLAEVSPRAQADQRRRRAAELAQRLEAAGPERRVRTGAKRVAELEARLLAGVRAREVAAKRRLAVGAARLDALSPLRVLDRGFVVVQRDGEAVTRAASVAAGDAVELRFADGRAKAVVDEVEPLD